MSNTSVKSLGWVIGLTACYGFDVSELTRGGEEHVGNHTLPLDVSPLGFESLNVLYVWGEDFQDFDVYR